MTKILALAAALGLAGCVALGVMLRGAWRAEAVAVERHAHAVEINEQNLKAARQREEDLARVRDQAIKLTEANRALNAAAIELRENLSDAARGCPVLDADLRALDRLLRGAPGGDPDRTPAPR